MSRTAVHVTTHDRGEFVPAGRPDRGTVVPAARSELGDFNFVLLALLAACAAFWALVVLTAFWLI